MSEQTSKSQTSFYGELLFALFLFWCANGFERVDCGLGVSQACQTLHASYAEKPKP